MEKDNSFDRIIKEKLQGIQPTFEPQNWELFEQKLESSDADTPQVDNTLLDRVVYDRLFNFEVPYDASTWKLLSARLDEELNFTSQVLRYKAIELAMMLLAIFTLFQYLPEIKNNQPHGFSQSATATSPESGNIITQNTAKKLVTSSPVLQKNNVNQTVVPTQEADSEDKLSDAVQNQAPVIVPTIKAIFPVALNYESEKESLASILSSLPISTVPEVVLEDALQKAITETQKVETFSSLEILNTIPSSNFAQLDAGDSFRLPLIKPYKAKQNRLTLGIFASLNYDNIILPPLEGDNNDAVNSRYSRGYSMGINLNIKRNRWGVGIGAIFNEKSYRSSVGQLVVEDEQENWWDIRIKDVNLRLLEVPITLHFDLLSSHGWYIYTFGGPSIQLLLKGHYSGPHRFAQGFVPPSRPGETDVDKRVIDEEDVEGLIVGFFNGGSFKENVYLAGQAGLGIERQVNHKWSVFAQSSYQFPIKHWNRGFGFNLEEKDNYQFEGIGSLREKFKTLSLTFGLRVGI